MSGQKSCLKDTNCCLTSQPCPDGALCVPTDPTKSIHNTRFACQCRPGYQGFHCEQPIRFCRDYYKMPEREAPKRGIYYLIDSNNKRFPVLCDFKKAGSNVHVPRVFTLIQSYKWNHKDSFEELLKNGTAINDDDPKTTPYRLSFPRMESIRQHSTNWRIDFSRQTKRVGCREKVDVDFHRQTCARCTARAFTKLVDETEKKTHQSECDIKNNGNDTCEHEIMDNFGLYCCIDIVRNCSSNPTKINIWLLENIPLIKTAVMHNYN